MKQHTIGVFAAREDAEKAINYIHSELNVPHVDISYIYRNDDGDVKEVETSKISSKTAKEGAGTGAKAGAVVGGLAGIAVAAGMIPVIGPIFAAGPILAAIGVTGAVGTTAAGVIGGAAVGGLIGALVNLGVGKEKAMRYQDQVMAGNILVAVHTDDSVDVAATMLDYNALDVEAYAMRV